MTNKNSINLQIGTKIRLERNKRKWSQEKLAEHANMNKNSIGFIERGESSPTAETLAKIADAFEMTLSELLDVSKIDL